ncbi:MAG: hypothetical protein ACI85Q_002061 [Salibacteraceae bacterium]|jgi:hypothetical protein
MKKKIFILLNDYTKLNPVITYGVNLAKGLESPAILLAIAKLKSPATVVGGGLPYPNLDFNSLKEKAILHLRKLYLEVQHIWRNVYCDVAIGVSQTKVISMMDEKDPFLLVIEGRSDLTTLNEWFGTYETMIAEEADCPVLVVQPQTVWRPVQKILYMMDMDDTKIDNLQILTTLTESLDAHLQVIIFSDKDISEAEGTYQEMINVFKNLLGYKEPTFHRIFGDKKAEDVIALVNSISPDWLAFEQKNKNFFERVFNDYNTKRLILQGEIPALVF